VLHCSRRGWTHARLALVILPGWPRGGVVTQRTANPYTPVRFRAWPPILSVSETFRFAVGLQVAFTF
jgi:hypothetical protein